MSRTGSVFFLRRMHHASPRQGGLPAHQPGQSDISGGDRIVCRCCGHCITSAGQRVEVNGSHEYTFTNPKGIVFRIGCFARVQGCLFAGQPTAEWSWFRGYLWSVAYCAGCGSHLGWRYSSGDDIFHGLVLRSIIIVS
jgi:hypothetical protein